MNDLYFWLLQFWPKRIEEPEQTQKHRLPLDTANSGRELGILKITQMWFLKVWTFFTSTFNHHHHHLTDSQTPISNWALSLCTLASTDRFYDNDMAGASQPDFWDRNSGVDPRLAWAQVWQFIDGERSYIPGYSLVTHFFPGQILVWFLSIFCRFAHFKIEMTISRKNLPLHVFIFELWWICPGISALFPGISALFPGISAQKNRHIFTQSRVRSAQKVRNPKLTTVVKKWPFPAPLQEIRPKGRNLANRQLFVSFGRSRYISLDWFKGKSTGNHGFYH